MACLVTYMMIGCVVLLMLWASPVTFVAAFTTNCLSSLSLRRSHNEGSNEHCVFHHSGKRNNASYLFSTRSAIINEKIRYIAGRRALILHPPPSNLSAAVYPPLVILGGMAQSISSWEFHLQQLSSVRTVMVYEALGQGPPPPSEVCSIDGNEVTLQQYYTDVTLERQGIDFWRVVDEAFFHPDSYYSQNYLDETSKRQVDVAGFSFGGRVAMAAATIHPNRIRRLHLTGVGAERDEYANIILASWKGILDDISTTTQEDDILDGCDSELHSSRCTSRLRAFAWSIILATYSEKFLESAGSKRVESWVDGVCRYNTEEGLRAILMQTHDSFTDECKEQALEFWTPAAMADRIMENQCVESCKVLVGSQDKMASRAQAMKLAQLLGLLEHQDSNQENQINLGRSLRVVAGCGHAVPMEAQRTWREDVVKFLTD